MKLSSDNHLDDLMKISVDGPPMSKWNSDGAVPLWWTNEQRQVAGLISSHPGSTKSSVFDLTEEVHMILLSLSHLLKCLILQLF